MTRDKEGQKFMSKFGLAILTVLNNNEIVTVMDTASISQILDLLPECQRKSYSTTYRHLQSMFAQGYIKCGLVDGLASTYFISDTGKTFCQQQY